MSKSKRSKKKVVVSTKKTAKSQAARKRATRSRSDNAHIELIFGRQNYILMAAGAGLIFLGLILMSGGSMPSPDVWEPERIYSFRRTTLAPILIIAGLVVEIFAIFKRPESSSETPQD